MTRDEIVDTMLEVARRRVNEDMGMTHPTDLGYAMSFAIETAAETLAVVAEKERAK